MQPLKITLIILAVSGVGFLSSVGAADTTKREAVPSSKTIPETHEPNKFRDHLEINKRSIIQKNQYLAFCHDFQSNR